MHCKKNATTGEMQDTKKNSFGFAKSIVL